MSDTPTDLTAAEARVLAVLIEKEKTTPDAYPLTVNSLVAGCNQKTSRDPVMSLSESEVQATLDALRHRTLVVDSYGASGRVMRYAHNFRKIYGVPAASVALLATLMLRGPQTVSELRANADRLHSFADASTVEGYLDELATWPAGALVVKLPRQPGTREQRWAQLLCGPVDVTLTEPASAANADDNNRFAELEQRVAHLERELAALRSRFDLPQSDDTACDQ
jgi:uncharacterized protein YceH (UPF0502 family)